MNDKRIMKYELVKLALQGVVSVTMTGIVDGLSQMIFRKPIKREKLVKIGNYIVSEIISGGISAVIDDEIDGIKEYYDELEYSPSLEVRDTGEEIVNRWNEMAKEIGGRRWMLTSFGSYFV